MNMETKHDNTNHPQHDAKLPVSGSAFTDKQLRKMAKKVCNGHQHAMRYNNMLNACFKMGKMILEELERKKADR